MARRLVILVAGVCALAVNAAAGPVDAVVLTVRALESYPPVPVTDLAAGYSRALPGSVVLNWTAPAAELIAANSRIEGYYIRYASFSALPDTEEWWRLAPGEIQYVSSTAPGDGEGYLLKSGGVLEIGTTYYFAIKSYNRAELLSYTDLNSATPGRQARICARELTAAEKNLLLWEGVMRRLHSQGGR